MLNFQAPTTDAASAGKQLDRLCVTIPTNASNMPGPTATWKPSIRRPNRWNSAPGGRSYRPCGREATICWRNMRIRFCIRGLNALGHLDEEGSWIAGDIVRLPAAGSPPNNRATAVGNFVGALAERGQVGARRCDGASNAGRQLGFRQAALAVCHRAVVASQVRPNTKTLRLTTSSSDDGSRAAER